jgi:UDP-N-acetylmuramyl pentapeptide phosphotransferase/UDP-N-acetylglucosamine-1-phosphate transferase
MSVDVYSWLRVVAGFLLSAFVTWLSIRYAHRRDLIDHPGQRRSHAEPTPRGGGIGIVIAALILFVPALRAAYPGILGAATAIASGLVLVAGVGWWDDHFGLAAPLRFAAHLLASIVLATVLMGADGAAVVLLYAFAIAWSVNLHNFMDGINGLLAAQAAFVFLVLGALGHHYAQPVFATSMWILASATLGFLPFNFPRARVFMGDVGSGALGFLIAAALGIAVDFGILLPSEALILVSAFVVDASCTLVSRMLRGRRWYSAHREHLYQWLARGASHAPVVGMFTAWNLLFIVPTLVLFELTDGYEDALCAGVYVVGIGLWLAGKRYCLQRTRKLDHAPA